MNLRMLVMDFNQKGEPRDTTLYEAVQEYHKNEFGEELNCAYYARVHALVLVDDDEKFVQVMGLLGIKNVIDVPMFHITVPTQDKAGLKLAEQGRDLMFQRGHNYLADLGNTGQPALVFVSEQAERYWRRFLKKIGAKPAQRYEVTL